MKKSLPARPNLEHLRTQAKELLAEWRTGNPEAAALVKEHLPSQARKRGSEESPRPRLADAQAVIARKNGFSSWAALVRHVDNLRQMEGTWEFQSLEVDGSSLPAATFGNSHMLIDGDRFRMESPEGRYEGIFTIDVEQTPSRIDIEFVEGPEAGNWSYGLFELEGDRLKICLGLTGASRPLGFATSPGSGHALEQLNRVTKSRPSEVKGGTPQKREPTPEVDVSVFEFKDSPHLTRLQGEWIPVQLIQSGQPLPPAMLSFGRRSMTQNEVVVKFGGQTMVHAKVLIDDTQFPIAVDYLNIGRSLEGQVSLGIMEWLDDEVRFCMAAPGAPRPSDFSCPAGSQHTLSQWKLG